MPCKDDKPKVTEITPFQAGSDYSLSARIAGDIKKSNMCIDFVSCDMSDAKKFEFLYDIEKNRDMFFDIFMGKYRSKNSYSHRQYKKWVTNM